MPLYQQSPPSGTHSPRSSPTCYQQSTSVTLLRIVDKVQCSLEVEGQRDRVGCREAIRVNRITVTAFGWLQLFKTRLRMGNFLSGSILELPHSVEAERKVLFHRERGGESSFCTFFFCPFRGFFCECRMCCPLS